VVAVRRHSERNLLQPTVILIVVEVCMPRSRRSPSPDDDDADGRLADRVGVIRENSNTIVAMKGEKLVIRATSGFAAQEMSSEGLGQDSVLAWSADTQFEKGSLLGRKTIPVDVKHTRS
jgi:hypothetical protein